MFQYLYSGSEGLVGYGEGEMALAPANGPTTTSDLSMRLGAGGAR